MLNFRVNSKRSSLLQGDQASQTNQNRLLTKSSHCYARWCLYVLKILRGGGGLGVDFDFSGEQKTDLPALHEATDIEKKLSFMVNRFFHFRFVSSFCSNHSFSFCFFHRIYVGIENTRNIVQNLILCLKLNFFVRFQFSCWNDKINSNFLKQLRMLSPKYFLVFWILILILCKKNEIFHYFVVFSKFQFFFVSFCVFLRVHFILFFIFIFYSVEVLLFISSFRYVSH